MTERTCFHKGFIKTFAVRICHKFHSLLRSMEYTVLNVQFSMIQTLIESFGYKWKAFCNNLKQLHWTIHKEAIYVKTDFKNFSGGTCHPNNRFDQSDSSSVTHALKTKFFVPNLFTGIADQHMSGRPSCITPRCEKYALTVLRYKFGSVYMQHNITPHM